MATQPFRNLDYYWDGCECRLCVLLIGVVLVTNVFASGQTVSPGNTVLYTNDYPLLAQVRVDFTQTKQGTKSDIFSTCPGVIIGDKYVLTTGVCYPEKDANEQSSFALKSVMVTIDIGSSKDDKQNVVYGPGTYKTLYGGMTDPQGLFSAGSLVIMTLNQTISSPVVTTPLKTLKFADIDTIKDNQVLSRPLDGSNSADSKSKTYTIAGIGFGGACDSQIVYNFWIQPMRFVDSIASYTHVDKTIYMPESMIKSTGLSTGAIVGIAVGGAAVLVLLIVGAVYIRRYRRENHKLAVDQAAAIKDLGEQLQRIEQPVTASEDYVDQQVYYVPVTTDTSEIVAFEAHATQTPQTNDEDADDELVFKPRVHNA
ncbi:hypothetical protein GQ42DRAFT_181577 [Ramicandelaber brevisporus]|nr:hypothetical protein GQ42DRAFT_181577 [Ramicandelaber brevisporus]